MRLLLIEDDARFRALLRHHISCRWPEAQLVSHNPVSRGPLSPEFLAQGFDAVLLDHSWPLQAHATDDVTGENPHVQGPVAPPIPPQPHPGLGWLQDLATRPGFAPLVFLSDTADSDLSRRARSFGAHAVIGKDRINHGELIEAVRAASALHQRALADWRITDQAKESRRFGSARIPEYRCIRRLLGGSVSQLFLAESEKSGSLVVIKVTPSMRDETGVDQSFERFLQEYEIARRLRHPNLVRCHELGVADDHAYLAMEYFPAGDLRRRMRGGLNTSEALSFALQIARALMALHAAGTLHRDLKPGNVLLRNDRSIALNDFGLAKHAALEFEITDPGIIFGTPQYMSPEQGHGQDVDVRSDLYSLGVILYEMLTGQKPYIDVNPMAVIYKHRNEPIPKLPPNLAHLQPLVERLLAKLPQDRFADATHAEAALAEVVAALADRAA